MFSYTMDNILNKLKEHREFTMQMEVEIQEIEQSIKSLEKEKKESVELINDLKSMKMYPEHEALIPMGQNIYMKGRIVHTGEVYAKKKAHPDSMVVLQSTDYALKHLENNVTLKENDIDKSEYAKFQVEERIKLLNGEDSFQCLGSDLPKEIKSDKGVAVKVGDYYEILEYES